MQDFLSFVVWNNTLKQWIIAAAFILGGILAGKVCSWIMRGVLRRISGKTANKADDIIVKIAEQPLILLVTLGGIALGLNSLSIIEAVSLWTDRILAILFIIVITGGLNKVVEALVVSYVPIKGTSSIIGKGKEIEIQPVLRKLVNVAAIAVGIILILKTLGYNISAILAGLGLGGAAVALASKDTLANFFGSITVFVDHPFRLNERIKIAGYDGVITEMSIRTSRLKTLENRTVTIPNSIFVANPIENISSAPNTKVSQTINIKSDNGNEKIAQGVSLLKAIGSEVEGTGGTPTAGLISVSGAACQISFVYFVARDADYFETVHRVNFEVLRRFEEAGIKQA
jgi:MscS family membrane protein